MAKKTKSKPAPLVKFDHHYHALGVHKNSTEEQMRASFHKLAWKHHPDQGGDAAVFAQLSESYSVLSNKKKRAEYEKFMALTGMKCAGCAGRGATSKSQGLTARTLSICSACKGSGYV